MKDLTLPNHSSPASTQDEVLDYLEKRLEDMLVKIIQSSYESITLSKQNEYIPYMQEKETKKPKLDN
jgi:putative aminopeptidase FrvX